MASIKGARVKIIHAGIWTEPRSFEIRPLSEPGLPSLLLSGARKSWRQDDCKAGIHTHPQRLIRYLMVRQEARWFLQGESPCRVRANHSPVPSVAFAAEFRRPERTKQTKRTQGSMQTIRQTALPECLMQPRKTYKCGWRRRHNTGSQYDGVALVRLRRVRRGHRGHGMYAQNHRELGRPCRFLSKEQRAGPS